MSARKDALLSRLRKKLQTRRASLADEFDYRMIVVAHFADGRYPEIYEVERVAVSMSNNAEREIRMRVEQGLISEDEADSFLAKDTVQIHARRWALCTAGSLSDAASQQDMSTMRIWPRPELLRVEAFLFSRWKAEEGGPAADSHRLLAASFQVHNVDELEPRVISLIKRRKRKGLLINDAQSFGIWLRCNHSSAQFNLTALMVCMTQDELTRWDPLGVSVDQKIDQLIAAFEASPPPLPPPPPMAVVDGSPPPPPRASALVAAVLDGALEEGGGERSADGTPSAASAAAAASIISKLAASGGGGGHGRASARRSSKLSKEAKGSAAAEKKRAKRRRRRRKKAAARGRSTAAGGLSAAASSAAASADAEEHAAPSSPAAAAAAAAAAAGEVGDEARVGVVVEGSVAAEVGGGRAGDGERIEELD